MKIHRAIRVVAVLGCAVSSLALTQATLAAEATDEAKTDNGIADSSDIVVTATKPNIIAPVTASLEATQPQSIVSRSFIQDSLSTAADFNQIALIAPSVSSFGGTNGVGLSESKAQIRGFQDGEYNITYDGVPFGDTNDPSHHSNTFFPSNTIETLIVDRGPGNASQLGQATFGGNVNLFSRAVSEEAGAEFLGSYGSFNTFVGQAVVQSGEIAALGGANFLASGQYVHSDGALSLERYKQINGYAKGVIPLGPDVTLSLIATINHNEFHQSDNDGASARQVLAFGKGYALSNDPNSQNYYRYNTTVKNTDFFIAKLDAHITDNTRFENSAYTYFYHNSTLSGLDATQVGGAANAANVVVLADAKTKVFGIPGYTKDNKYRVYGDIMKLHLWLGDFATLTLGAWLEASDTFRQQSDVNLLTGAPDYREKAVTVFPVGTPASALAPRFVRFDQDSSGNHTEEFAELALHPLPGLTITPGFKHVDFNRKIDALYNQTTRYTQRLTKTYTANLPFVTANWQIDPTLAVYAQYARGFLAPPLSQLYVANPGLSTVDPQRSTNYQAGAVYHGRHLSLDVDVYKIDFTNKFIATGSGLTAGFTNIGGAKYKGIEGQATYAFDNGLAVFANGSRNYAKSTTTGLQIDRAPVATAAGGLLYKHGPIKLSLIDKYTAHQNITLGAAFPSLVVSAASLNGVYRIPAYNTAIASASYDFGRIKVGIKASDLFDSRRIINISGTQYFFQPGRQITGEVTIKL
jgi:iron complex outermembrane receptor protein